jgi:hypothetical protein
MIGPIEDSRGMPHQVHMVSASKPGFDLEAIKLGRQHRFIPGSGLEKSVAVALNTKVNFEKIIESSS